MKPLACIALLVPAFAGCNHCEDLERKLCNDLGAEDCAVWKAPPLNKSGIGTERMTSEACSNAKSGVTYDRMLEEAKSRVLAKKKLDSAKETLKKVEALRKGGK